MSETFEGKTFITDNLNMLFHFPDLKCELWLQYQTACDNMKHVVTRKYV